VAEPVLLISNDPFLGSSLEALAHGRLRVARIDPVQRSAAWPGPPTATVVLDLARRELDHAYPWVRNHHPGRVVLLLKPGEPENSLPPDPDRLVIRRPFRLVDLVEILTGVVPSAEPDDALSDGPSPAARVSRPPGGRDPAPSTLLQASSEQRRRRLGSLSPAAPNPAAAPSSTAAPVPPVAPPAATAGPPTEPAVRPARPDNPKATARRAAGWEATAAKMEAARQAAAERRVARAAKAAAQAPTRPPARTVAPPTPAAPPVPPTPSIPAAPPGPAEHPTAPPELPAGLARQPAPPPEAVAGSTAAPAAPPEVPTGGRAGPGGPKEAARRAAGWDTTAAKMEAARQAAAERRAARAASRAAQAPTRQPARGPQRTRRPTAARRPGNAGKPRRERRRWSPALGILGGVLAVVTVAGGWLGFGLLQAREDLRTGASGFRTELTKAEAALRRGDPDAAKAAVRAAARDLDVAEAVTTRRPMRVAARLPLLSGGVSDASHLLAAARNLTRAGDRAVAVSTHLQSGRFAVLERGRFDLDALQNAINQAKGLVAELDRVRAELALVRGGPLAPGSDETKRWALERLDEAVARARPVVPTLAALPAALGADQPRTYLVALTSPAELRPGGGVPLAVVEVGLDDGTVQVRARDGAIAENVHNAQATWTAVPGDPWASGGRFTEFSLANSSPHFPTAGQELLRAYAARGRSRPDGVIAIDPLAMKALLRATGAVTVPGYGRLTAANCVKATTHDAYVRWPSRVERRRYNEALLQTLLARLLSGHDLVTTGKVLGAAGARRQVQIYASDPALQRALAGSGMDGAISVAAQDYLAVHTLNTNRSRMDYFQSRRVHHLVELRPDGSAEVTRTVRIANPVPPGEPIQDGQDAGYASGRAAAVLANYLPPGAKVQEAKLDGRPVRPAVTSEGGRPLVRVDLDLAPGQSAEFLVRYLTPRAAAAKDGFRYRFTADPQVTIRPPALRVDVFAPPGMSIAAVPGWTVDGATATLRRPFTDAIDVSFDLRG
jgi:uncharacterized protein DUF4012